MKTVSIILIIALVTFTNTLPDMSDSNFNLPNINKMLDALSMMRQKLRSGRASTHKFLQAQAAQPIDPLVDALKHVKEGVDEFNKNYDNFFDTKKIEEAQKYIIDNKTTVYAVDNGQAVKMMTALELGLSSMVTVKSTIKQMTTKITDGIRDVKSTFEDTKKAENAGSLTDDQKKLAFTVAVQQLDKILLAAIQDSYDSSKSLEKVKDNMITLNETLGGLMA